MACNGGAINVYSSYRLTAGNMVQTKLKIDSISMKHAILIFLCLVSVAGCSSSCNKNNVPLKPIKTLNKDTAMSDRLKITINSHTFTATLSDNSSAKALKELLPMTITMTELNGNEKYFNLPADLPTQSSSPRTIHEGDLMLYGSNTLVLFYKTFSTSYSYTKLGQIDHPSGLHSALGTGNPTVTFTFDSASQ